jgi:hypothetical protein
MFSTFYSLLMEGYGAESRSRSGSTQIIMNPDAGAPKKYGSNVSGSTSLLKIVNNVHIL